MKEVFEHIMQDTEIKFKHAKGMRDIIGKEFHQYHEIFLFRAGNAEFISETKRNRLEPNTLVIIPKNTFHRFFVRGDDADYERFVFNFYEIEWLALLISQTMSSIVVLSNISQNIINEFEKIAEQSTKNYSEYEKKLLLRTSLTAILMETKYLIPTAEKIPSNLSPITAFCVRYINENIHKKISIGEIAAAANYSKSNITHIFKKELQIPIYTYITDKKLIAANLKIQAGALAMDAAEMYGFGDYSCFYRLYKKKFGVAPNIHSKEKNVHI